MLEIAVSTGECLADVDGAAGGVTVDAACVTADCTDWEVGTGGREAMLVLVLVFELEPFEMAGDPSPE